MAKVTQLVSRETKIQTLVTEESEQAKDMETLWKSALVARQAVQVWVLFSA